MRIAWTAAPLLLLFIASCTDWNPGYAPDGDGGARVEDGAPGPSPAADLAQAAAAPDLARAPDLAMPAGGGTGAPCKTACDCQAGLQCGWNGQCAKAWTAVYCCDAAMCPQGSTCQSKAGNWSRCGMGGGGGGGGGYCQYIPCQNDTLCKQAGCGSCDMAKRVCQ